MGIHASDPRGTRSFPLFVMFNPDGSVKPTYTPMTRDKRPVVVIPANMMNRPSRHPTDRPNFQVCGVPVYPDRFYQINVRGRTAVVPGRYFRSRATRPGTYSVKMSGQRVKVPNNMVLSEVSFSYNAGTGATVPTGQGLVALPASGAVPRGYNAVMSIGGQQVSVSRKHLRPSNSRPGQMVVKHGETTHLVASNAIMMQAEGGCGGY